MNDFEQKCYGVSAAEIRKHYINGITARRCGLEFVVMGLLSDAQELQKFGHPKTLDQSRKNMNIAKFILSEMMEAKEVA